MLRQIIQTVGSKFVIAGINFACILLITNFLGAEGKGQMSLFILNLSFVMMFNDFVGGPALVYLLPRYSAVKILEISLFWALSAALVMALLFDFLGLNPFGFWVLFLAAFFHAISSVLSHYLLGQGRVFSYNMVQTLYPVIVLLGTGLSFLVFKWTNLQAYLWSLVIGFFMATVLGFVLLLQSKRSSVVATGYSRGQLLVVSIRYGFWVQVGNMAQLLNYRFAFYLLEAQGKTAHLGRFSTAINLAESVWLISKGVAAVHYSKIANSEDSSSRISITNKVIRFNLVSALGLIALLLLLPDEFYAKLFGGEFVGMSRLIVYLSPGIAIFAISNGLSHYFSGIGKHKINMWSSLISLFPTLVLSPILIQNYDLLGACVVYNVSYVMATVYQLSQYFKEKETHWWNLVPKFTDVSDLVKGLLKR